jgi:hypothetical protein
MHYNQGTTGAILIIQVIEHRDPSKYEIDLQSFSKHVNIQGFLRMDRNLLSHGVCIDRLPLSIQCNRHPTNF